MLSLRKEKLEIEGHSEDYKTTLMVKLPEDDRSGVSHQVLSVFAWRRLNLSKIESRPLKTGLGNYFFIIDVMESDEHPMIIAQWKSSLHLIVLSAHLALILHTTNCRHVIQYDRAGFFVFRRKSFLCLSHLPRTLLIFEYRTIHSAYTWLERTSRLK